MTVPALQGPDFSEAQWQSLQALATTLDQRQLLWASGFLAGVEHAARGSGRSAPADGPASALASGTAEAKGRTLTILYGSETGNSTALARDLAERAEAGGLAAKAIDMAGYKERGLKDEQDLIVITSTYGEGDPPQPAAGFFEMLEGRKAPKLSGLRFAVLALGDSTYERFCEAGKRIDRRLEELGATRLAPRIDCDVDYEAPASSWAADILGLLLNEGAAPASAHGPGKAARPAGTAATPKGHAPVYDKRTPFPARIIDNVVLTGRGSTKETRHVEFALDGSGLVHEPGDALGLIPENDGEAVEALAAAFEIDPSTTVDVGGEAMELGQALRTKYEIATLTPRFIELWAGLSGADELAALARTEAAQQRASFARAHHVVDVVRRFPVKGADASAVLAGLRPLQPRLYSIASSAAAAPDEVHITVSTVRYSLHGDTRKGIASGHLAERGSPDTALPVYIQRVPHFRLPADDMPIIMIGAGTGIAPYRAFMQEREARGATGRSWLFLGERNFRTDFLYQTEWQSFLRDGVLTRMDVAFSRDRDSDGGGGTYVQDRLRENAWDLFGWLEEGAHLYLCGDATRLAPAVHLALGEVVRSAGGLGSEGADEYLRNLLAAQRYHRDVY